MSDDFNAYNISHLREIAARRLSKGLFEFIDRAAEDGVALRNNLLGCVSVAELNADYLYWTNEAQRPRDPHSARARLQRGELQLSCCLGEETL